MSYTFAELLRQFRTREGLTQLDLADAIGRSRNAIGAWERGDYLPRFREDVLQIGEALNLSERETNRLLVAANYPEEPGVREAEPSGLGEVEERLAGEHERRRVEHEEILAAIGGRAAAAPPYQAPRVLDEFVGREEEIERLARALRPGQKVAITGIVGMGGLGKTELAKVAADRAARRFRDGVLWADWGEQDAATIADLWAAAYGVQLPGEDAATKAAGWRGIVSGKEALQVFDNVQPGQEVEALFPPRGRSAVLLTSRDAGHPALIGAERVVLNQFTDAEALALAGEVLGRKAAREQEEEAKRLFALLGYLPLGVSVALHVAEEGGWRFETLNEKLEGAGALAVLGDEEALHKSLRATFETAWVILPEELAETFQTLAVFNAGPSFSTAALAETLGLGSEEAGARLRRLARRSLLMEVGDGRWALHRLLREFAETKGPVSELAHFGMARHYEGVLRAAKDLYLQGGNRVLAGLALFDRERGHIVAGQAWAAGWAGEDDQAARLCSEYSDAGGYVLYLRLHAREWIGWLEAAARAASQLGEREAKGKHLGRLGVAYADLGETRRAIEYHQRALEIKREIGDKRGEGATLGNLGLAYVGLGEARRAIEYYEQALGIHREIGDRRGEGINLGNLGRAYCLLGEARQAIEYHEQALGICREIGDKRGEGHQLGNLGGAYKDLGETRWAIEHTEQALGICREIGDRQGEGVALGNLGVLHRNLGETQRAIEYFEQALGISREIGGRQNEGVWLGNLGLAYADLGQPRRAIGYHQQALRIHREIGDRRGEGVDLANLGEACRKLGEARRAIEYNEQALGVARQIGDRRVEGAILGDLGLAYADLGETWQAKECLAEAMRIFEGIEDPRAAQVRRQLAELDREGAGI
jgi:tetratricopeptide (TPR) repeat protein/transcriptional regulator with XRE-family HTH domain